MEMQRTLLGSFDSVKTGEMIDHHPRAFMKHYHDPEFVEYYNSFVCGNFLAWRRICVPFLLDVKHLSETLDKQYHFATSVVKRIMNGFVVYEKFPVGMLDKAFVWNTVAHIQSEEEEVDFLLAMAKCKRFEIITVPCNDTFQVVTKMYSDKNALCATVMHRAFGMGCDIDVIEIDA